MLIGRKNDSLESINNSIQQNVSRWGVSNEMNEQIMTNIVGLQMKKIRLIKKKTQTRVANKLSVSFQQEQKYEKGTNECRFVNIKKLSEYFGVELDYWTRPLDEANCKFLTKKRENGYDYQEQR
jgi:ABC-type phosphate transport system auxiliary subunit